MLSEDRCRPYPAASRRICVFVTSWCHCVYGVRREPGEVIGADDLQSSGGDHGAAQGRHGGARSVTSAGGPAGRCLERP